MKNTTYIRTPHPHPKIPFCFRNRIILCSILIILCFNKWNHWIWRCRWQNVYFSIEFLMFFTKKTLIFIQILKHPITNNNLILKDLLFFCWFLCVFLIFLKLNLGLRRIACLFFIYLKNNNNYIIPIERMFCHFFERKKQ